MIIKVKDLVSKMSNGGSILTVWNKETGEVLASTFNYESLPESLLELEVEHIGVREYEIRFGVKE